MDATSPSLRSSRQHFGRCRTVRRDSPEDLQTTHYGRSLAIQQTAVADPKLPPHSSDQMLVCHQTCPSTRRRASDGWRGIRSLDSQDRPGPHHRRESYGCFRRERSGIRNPGRPWPGLWGRSRDR
jgi:hypothetical protein